ncbi:MAG: N-acetyltransferase [Erysipelotrichia bacterium]|nr:N-acetyltransferase [Erysipelotrichia bacterium]
MTKIETERLILRDMTQDDFCSLSSILQNPAVMYAYEGAFTDEEVHAWLNKQIYRYKNDGYGLWSVILKTTGTMIGQCGLTNQVWENQDILEVGYLFAEKYWHHGYATEAARACMDYGFHTLNAKEIYSIIRDTNNASQNVARRNGMTETARSVRHYRGIDMPHVLFQKKNTD